MLADARAETEDQNLIEEDTTPSKTELNKELLIEAVRNYPVLWQPSHPCYKDATKKKILWMRISNIHFEKKFGSKYIYHCLCA